MSLGESSSAIWESSWIEYAPASFAKERKVYDTLKQRLKPLVPLRIWSKFEFIGHEGAAFDVDLLILSPAGVFLVELHHEAALLEIDERYWLQRLDHGGVEVLDSPMWRARNKAERLQALLDGPLLKKYAAHCPKISPLVILCDAMTQVEFKAEVARAGVVFLHPGDRQPDAIDAISRGVYPGSGQDPIAPLHAKVVERLDMALELAGVDEGQKNRRLGDWLTMSLLETGPTYQDYLAKHDTRQTRQRLRLFTSNREVSHGQQQQIMRAAKREYEVLAALQHPHILKVERWIEAQAPALIFEPLPDYARLDQLLMVQQDWSTRDRLSLLRQITEAIKYAHRQDVIHRALTPSSVLVHGLEARRGPQAKVYNWQMSFNAEQLTGTRHIHDYLDEGLAVYMAPEISTGYTSSEATDVWGLGCLAYTLFTQRPPAPDVATLTERLMAHGGLRASAQADGVPKEIDALIFEATHPIPRKRLASVDAFLDRLEALWRFAASAEEDEALDPRDAKPGDVLEDRFHVVRSLGSGASAVALLVRPDQSEQEVVLKIAQTERDDLRLEREAAELRKLADAKNVVSILDVTHVHDRITLVLEYGGESLSGRLVRERAGLSLQDLERFGKDLCKALTVLEHAHILHRDIKPANLGIQPQSKGRSRLVLFDFSLAGTPLDQIGVGTSAYRDPFLLHRKRWDHHADRYAAAITLYEMATGQRPQWGDGSVSPALDVEATLHLEPDALHSAAREGLMAFFTRALHREVKARFDFATDMLAMWEAAFEQMTTSSEQTSHHELAMVTEETKLRAIPCSDAVREAFDRLNLFTVQDLLGLSLQSIHFQHGLADVVRRELTELHKRLSEQLPLFTAPSLREDHDLSHASLDQCLKVAIEPDADLLYGVLTATHEGGEAFPWMTHAQMAQRIGRDEDEFMASLHGSIQQWAKDERIKPLRDEVVRIVEHSGGALSARALSKHLLATHATSETQPSRRMAIASAVARIAVEAQLIIAAAQEDAQSFEVRRVNGSVFIITRPRLGSALERLGKLADEMAHEETLRSGARAYDALMQVLSEVGAEPVGLNRLLTLAVEASTCAALSSRNEIYKVNLELDRALRLSKGALSGYQSFSFEELRAQIENRYPEVTKDYDREVLEHKLNDLNIPLRWSATEERFLSSQPSPAHPSLSLTRSGFSADPSVTLSQELDFDRDAFERDLRQAHAWGGFRVLMAEPRDYEQAIAQQAALFPQVHIIDLDKLWFEAIDAFLAQNTRLTLDRLLSADAPDAPSAAKNGMAHVLRHNILPWVRERLSAYTGQDLLIINPGLLGRYHEQGSMAMLEELSDQANTPTGPRKLWVLLPAHNQSEDPMIEHVAVPRTSPSQITRLTHRWFRA